MTSVFLLGVGVTAYVTGLPMYWPGMIEGLLGCAALGAVLGAAFERHDATRCPACKRAW
jgi:hypothetical protein